MARLAQMDEYDSRFGRRLVDEDFLAAGFTPEEVQQYRGAISQPSLAPEDRAAMEARYGLLQAPDYTMRQTAANRAQDRMIIEGVDPYVAGLYSRRIFGDTAPTDGGLGIGLADFTPLGIPFGIQEGSRTAAQGYQQGDPLQMGLGALEAGMGLLEATPLTAAIGRGIAATASRMDPNTLFSVFGPPRAPSATGETTGIRAFHGSPHEFDRFSMGAIGTGEGAQAYGPGLYFAEAEPVARMYRDQLSQGNASAARRTLESAGGDVNRAISDTEAKLRRLEERASAGDFGGDERRFNAQRQIQIDKLNQLTNFRNTGEFNAGRMYEVNIRANPEDFIDYDAPLSAQSENVQRFANERWQQIMGRSPDPTIEGEYILKMASPQFGIDSPDWLLRGGPGDAQRERLLEAGIPGVRYLDAGSRGAGDGSRNLVVFDENLIEIVRKYGIAGAAALLGVSVMDVEQAMAQGSQPQPQGLLSGLQ